MSRHAAAVRTAHSLGYRVTDTGAIVSPLGTILHPSPGNRGYYLITFRRDGEWERFNVHKLAAFQWFGERALDRGVVVRHLDGNRANNARSNIAIGSQQENMLDRPVEERVAHAFKAAKARRLLTPKQACELVKRSLQGWTGKRLAAHYGVRKSTVSEILSGKIYSEATGLTRRVRKADAAAELELAKGVA